MKVFILIFALMVFPVMSNASEYFAYSDGVLITNNVKFIEILPNSNVKFENSNGDVFLVKKGIENLQFVSHDNVKIKILNNSFYKMKSDSSMWEKLNNKNILK